MSCSAVAGSKQEELLIAGEVLGSEHIHTSLGLCEDVCEQGESPWESFLVVSTVPSLGLWGAAKGVKYFSIIMKTE